MKDKNFRPIKRRDFLISASGVVGTAVTGVGWAAGKPCPPPTVIAQGGSTSFTSCAPGQIQLPVLILTSAATSATYPWTFGQSFRKGDVPPSYRITTDASSSQADVRNRWSDGSVKFAVLSGVSSFTQNVAKPVTIQVTNAAASGTNVPEPTALDVSVVLTGDVTGTYTLQSCLGVDRSTWSLGNAGRVRQILGAVMSEFHYYRPTTNAHVAIWFYVRKYSTGAVEVETVVENGWINVASPGVKAYGITVNVSGSAVYTGSLTHYHHTRWSRVDWIGTAPQITPAHDPAYLRATKLVPNYGYTLPSAAAFANLASVLNPVPFTLGNWSANMGQTGDQPAIAILPRWEALYCTSADSRAYAATISNNRGSGRWPIHYRDETTGRPPLYASYPNLCLVDGWGTPPPSAGGGGPSWDIPHHPSNGYLAYLIEGRWPQLESLQFSADYAILDSNPETRDNGGAIPCWNAPLTTRGAAWAWRTVGQAAGISPTLLNGSAPSSTDAAVQSAFASSMSNTCTFMMRRYIDGSTDSGKYKNTIGWLSQYDGGDDGPATEWWGRCWMVNFQSMALGHISDLDIENFAAPANLVAVRNHSYQNALLRLGDESTWNFRRGANYDAPYLKNSSTPSAPVFMTPAEMYASYKSFNSLSPISANPGETLKDHGSGDVDMTGPDSSTDFGGGYWGFEACVAAMATEHGVATAQSKYALIAAASNFSPGAHGANDDPRVSIVPR